MANRARLKNVERYRQAERLRQQRARAGVRDVTRAIKVEAGCADCGERHPACLQFHHDDPAEKKFSIRSAIAEKTPVPLVLAEIKKCTVLCANCHAKRHWNERQGQPAA